MLQPLNIRFFHVFRGYRKGAQGCNGLRDGNFSDKLKNADVLPVCEKDRPRKAKKLEVFYRESVTFLKD